MIAPLATFPDWLLIQKLTFGRMPAINTRSLRLEQAIQFLNSADFVPAESQPARVEFVSGKDDFHFPTPRPGSVAENNVVHGRLYRCQQEWQKRPTIILLHGGSMMAGRRSSWGYQFGYPLLARRCNRAGFNAVTLELPHNFQRHSRRPETANRPDYLWLAEAVAQAIAEIRALTGWLLEQGCPGIALWGVSMGGWLAGLTACRDARLSAVVMTVPIVCSNHFAEHIIWRRAREAWRAIQAEGKKLDATPFNPTSAQLAIAKEKVLLIGGIYDLICPLKPIEKLWQLWGQPDFWRLPHGHISFMFAPGLTSRVLRWLSPRLNKSAD
jgi:pimeloyl-ACP methyl ester carboxylesterase